MPLALQATSPDTISTYAGGGPNNVPATQGNVPYPVNAAVDNAGNLYFVTSLSSANGQSNGSGINRVYNVNSSGTVTVVAGDGYAGYTGDGGLATQAELNFPSAIAVDSSANVYIADTHSDHHGDE